MTDTISTTLSQIAQAFRQAKIPNPDQEAMWLISDITKIPSAELTIKDRQITAQEEVIIREAVQDRIEGTPLAYIIGNTNFYGYKITVNKSVLIPRVDSEIVVETVLQNTFVKKQKILNIVDLGCGSGCLSLVLSKELHKKNISTNQILLVDIDSSAIQVAKHNSQELSLYQICDWLVKDFTSQTFPQSLLHIVKQENKQGNTIPTIIISNPPYIKTGDLKNITPELKQEPFHALDGGKDGTLYYRSILKWMPELLKQDYRKSFRNIFFEIHPGLSNEIIKCAQENGNPQIHTHQDIQSRDRVMEIEYTQDYPMK